MKSWQELLAEKKILVADGAWGTELARRGLGVGEPPEKWNLERPDEVEAVAASYVAAGSDIILTNTFGGSRLKLEKSGLGDRTAEVNRIGAEISKRAAGADIILTNTLGGSRLKLEKSGLAARTGEVNRTGAEISKRAAGDNALVFGSVGPTGEFMAPLGTVTEAEMVACFAEQIGALSEGGVDAILIETQSDLGEAKAALSAARESTDLSVAVSMTFEKGVKGYATIMGVTPVQAADELQAAGADIVGSNCGGGMEQIIAVISEMKPVADRPVWAKPNAGLPELVEGRTVFRETPEQMASHFAELAEAGADIIGGCCGTTPGHLALFVAERDKLV